MVVRALITANDRYYSLKDLRRSSGRRKVPLAA
jgi:hypothetical protein